VASFYLDNDAPLRMATLLTAAGHQAVTARGLGRAAADDHEHLLVAAQRGAIIITHNAKDFVLLHGAWLRWSAAWAVTARHSGILILPQPTAAERTRGAMDVRELTRLVLDLNAVGAPQSNELWQWQRGRAWVQSPPPFLTDS